MTETPSLLDRRGEWALVWLLRIGGVITVLAFPTVLLPTDWMAVIHDRVGLGEFPASPLVDYLTRSLSLMYGFLGVLMLVAAANVRRIPLLATYVAWVHVVLGVGLFAVALHADLPFFWKINEGPQIAIYGAALVFLSRRVQRSLDKT